MFEAMITNTWLASQTEELRVGSLVLCDSFRHPAVLAREAVTLDHASGGRFELGIGWGSVADGARHLRRRVARAKGPAEPAARIARDHQGALDRRGARLRGRALQPARCAAGARTRRAHSDRHRRRGQGNDAAGRRARRLVERAHPHRRQARRDAPLAGKARCSLQAQVAFVPRQPAHGTRSRRRRGGASDRRRSSAPRPSSSTTSARCRNGAWNGSTRGSATLPRRTRLAAFGEGVIREFNPTTASDARAASPSLLQRRRARPDKSLGRGLQCAAQIESVDTQCCPGPRYRSTRNAGNGTCDNDHHRSHDSGFWRPRQAGP